VFSTSRSFDVSSYDSATCFFALYSPKLFRVETTVYCDVCGRSRTFSSELWESKYRDIITGKGGAMMMCDDQDCLGCYRLEKPATVRQESA
jgi:hypothetical protein